MATTAVAKGGYFFPNNSAGDTTSRPQTPVPGAVLPGDPGGIGWWLAARAEGDREGLGLDA